MDVFVVRTQDDVGNPNAAIFDSLRAGFARIGWSSSDEQDLREVRRALGQGSLTEEQQYARRCLGFLLRPSPGDILLYPNVPDIGQFIICDVADGGYRYLPHEQALPGTDGDFRSALPVKLSWPEPVAKDDPRVAPSLRNRLGKQGRFSQISDPTSVNDLLERLRSGASPELASTSLERLESRLKEDLEKIVSGLGVNIQAEHPAKDLSSFVHELFHRMGFDSVLQEGPGERGSDVVIEVDHEVLPRLRIGAQVFSWQGDAAASSVRVKLEQLVSGWEANRLDFGVLVTTARADAGARLVVADHNNMDRGRRVRLIDRRGLADLFLRHWLKDE